MSKESFDQSLIRVGGTIMAAGAKEMATLAEERDQAIRERDEALAQAELWKQQVRANQADLDCYDQVEAERDQAIRERDEAQRQLELITSYRVRHREAIRKANAERDEARAVAQRFRARRKRGAPWSTAIDAEDCRDNPWLMEKG